MNPTSPSHGHSQSFARHDMDPMTVSQTEQPVENIIPTHVGSAADAAAPAIPAQFPAEDKDGPILFTVRLRRDWMSPGGILFDFCDVCQHSAMAFMLMHFGAAELGYFSDFFLYCAMVTGVLTLISALPFWFGPAFGVKPNLSDSEKRVIGWVFPVFWGANIYSAVAFGQRVSFSTWLFDLKEERLLDTIKSRILSEMEQRTGDLRQAIQEHRQEIDRTAKDVFYAATHWAKSQEQTTDMLKWWIFILIVIILFLAGWLGFMHNRVSRLELGNATKVRSRRFSKRETVNTSSSSSSTPSE